MHGMDQRLPGPGRRRAHEPCCAVRAISEDSSLSSGTVTARQPGQALKCPQVGAGNFRCHLAKRIDGL